MLIILISQAESKNTQILVQIVAVSLKISGPFRTSMHSVPKKYEKKGQKTKAENKSLSECSIWTVSYYIYHKMFKKVIFLDLKSISAR